MRCVGTLDGAVAMPADSAIDPDADASLTHTGTRLGTPRYMAPEQHCGRAVDERTDQYSYSASLYEALYGERPFDGATYRELLANITAGTVQAAPAPVAVPEWLRRTVLRGLQADPDDRFPSMKELLAELEAGWELSAPSP